MSDSRQNSFDFVRVVAAVLVIYSHQFALNGSAEPSVLNVHSLGGFGVLMFFSISGFLVAKSWEADPNLLRFGIKRFLRIWPGFAFAITVTALILGPLVSTLTLRDYLLHPGFWDYFNNLKFSLRDELPLKFSGNAIPTSINGSIWTIPLEVKCYLLLALLGLLGLLRRRLVVVVLTVAVVFAYAVLEPRGDYIVNGLGWSPEQRFLLEFGLFFLMGIIFNNFRLLEDRRKALGIVGLCWLFAGLAYVCARPLLSLIFVVPATTLMVGSASIPWVRRFGRFGDLSYGLYLYAFPVQQTLIWFFRDKFSWEVILLLVLITTSTFSFVSWHLVEKWALKMKP